MTAWIDTLLQGLMMGGLYSLFATGLALSFGVMRMINIAHGDFAILAAFMAIAAVASFGLNLFVVLLLVIPVMAVFGYGLQRLVLNRTLGKDILPPLLVTFGFSIVIQNLLMEIFSADTRSLDAGSFATDSLDLGGGYRRRLFAAADHGQCGGSAGRPAMAVCPYPSRPRIPCRF